MVTFSTTQLDRERLHVVDCGMSTDQDVRQHRFETAGLGLAPFKYIGFSQSKFQAAPGEPIRAGSSCDYCGTAIMDCYAIESSDGKVFKVGSDCVAKTGDRGIMVAVKSAANKHKLEARHASEAKRIAAFEAELATEAVRTVLAAIPHPRQYWADQGQTLLDSVEWFMSNAGNSGKLKTARMVAKIMAGK
jgi:hypothetical protein